MSTILPEVAPEHVAPAAVTEQTAPPVSPAVTDVTVTQPEPAPEPAATPAPAEPTDTNVSIAEPEQPAPVPDPTVTTTTTSTDTAAPLGTDSEPTAHHITPDARSNLIEQIFQKVEEASERRAREQLHFEEERSRPSTANRTSPNSTTTAVTAAAAAATAGRDPARDRRRGSISVSRFGQAADLAATGTLDTPSKLPSRKNSLIINAGSNGAFYKAQKYAGSEDSFASDTQETPRHEEVHDEEQVTQMETIAGRVSLGKAMGRTIARRLSRARTRSRDILAVPNGLVIGVSVKETTIEAEHHDEDEEVNGDVPRTPLGTAFVYAEAMEKAPGTRSRRSTISMPIPPPSAPAAITTSPSSGADKRLSTANWMARAKDLTKRFKRASMAILPPNSSP